MKIGLLFLLAMPLLAKAQDANVSGGQGSRGSTGRIGSVLQGGYDKAKWGMTVAEVKELYPGGLAKQTDNGGGGYQISPPARRGVAGDITAHFLNQITLHRRRY